MLQDEQDKRGRGEKPEKSNSSQTLIMVIVAALITFTLVTLFSNGLRERNSKELPYNEFMQLVEDGSIRAVTARQEPLTARIVS